MLDRDLTVLYGVEVKRLNHQVNRNLERFPGRFMHQMTARGFEDLELQIATSSWGRRSQATKDFYGAGHIHVRSRTIFADGH